MKNLKIDLVRNGDWTALYINNRKICENHILSDTDILDALDANYYVHELDIAEFPDKLNDIHDIE